MLFVSFWDEYGVSVGATAVPELLASGTWSHLLVSRDFDTGRVKVYHNGRIVDDIDDDFPNKISLPIKGSLRLGSSQKEDDVKFKGRFACFQFYTTTPTDQEVLDSKEYCLPSHWKITPQITLETRQVDGVEKQCVTDYVVPREQGEPEQCDVINMACLTSGLNWESVLQKHKWTTGKRDSAYFHLIGRDRIPVPGDDIVLGDVMITDKALCSRLCLRVEGCQAFSSVVKTTNATQCLLYRRVADPVEPQHGAVYFSKV
ncbi:unnamed protein product [Lymnaea stagnalis]|uniref:Uncharacterized protein n=1 Tax=Lymnaea stagnalis TaxID=6523 RepID=A0AAV2HWK5_LYMST